MKETKADLLLHPIRMKIIQEFIGGKKRNVQQLLEQLPDIPQATMYRHLNKLVKADIVKVVEEKKVRGAMEKMYALGSESTVVSEEELKESTKEDHMRYFITFMANVLGDFEKYLSKENVDMKKDGAGYRQVSFHLSDEEFYQLSKDMAEVFMKVAQNEPSPERKKRIFSTIVMPEVKEKGE